MALLVPLSRKNLSRIEDAPRIERLLDGAHHAERVVAGFLAQEALLVQTDAVFAAAGAAEFEGAAHELGVEAFGQFALFGFGGVDEVADVVVAVAHMADDKVGQPGGVGLGDGVVDAFGQARNGHAGVGGDAAAAGFHLQR